MLWERGLLPECGPLWRQTLGSSIVAVVIVASAIEYGVWSSIRGQLPTRDPLAPFDGSRLMALDCSCISITCVYKTALACISKPLKLQKI